MMKKIAVMRLLNEDDIIEANIRHHLDHLDHFVILDDGSMDRTIDIVSSLINEGLPITLIQKPNVVSDERGRNTFLYNYASKYLNADWVFFLDADEFIDMRGRIDGMESFINAIPDDCETMLFPMRNYKDTVLDDIDQIIVPERMTWRTLSDIGVYKVAVRGKISGNIHIHEGNHTAYRNGVELKAFGGSNLSIAHYPRRSGWQDIYKWIMMRLKITAAGERETSKGTGAHYIKPLEIFMNNPNSILNDKGFFERLPNENEVNDKIKYDGGPLKYTKKTDFKAKCIQLVLETSFSIAREFGNEMDNNENLRERILSQKDWI